MDTGTLRRPPDPLSRGERGAAWILAVIVGLTRWPALSRTLWDWDEALFSLAVRDFDVAAYHPHPPGFPLFIAIAKLVPADPFHALQAVVFVASLLIFPAMFFLARELRLDGGTSIAAAVLLALFPNVWFYGGTALSDVPSMVLVVAASALLLRGCRDARALMAGAVLLGIAAGFRPQNLMIGGIALAIAFLHQRRAALLGALIVTVIVIATYAGTAALSGGWTVYRDVLARHEAYIRQTDSFLAPARPGLIQVADDFFFWPYRAPVINIAVMLLAVAGALRRRSWLAIALFGPFALFAWLFLDFHSASRFSVGYMPLIAVLAAAGMPRRVRVPLLAALAAALIVWTWPALRIVHTTISPPVAAMQSVHAARSRIYVDGRLAPHAALLLDRYELVQVKPPFLGDRDAILVREGATAAPGSTTFARDRARLAAIARDRYFEVSVIPGRRPAQ